MTLSISSFRALAIILSLLLVADAELLFRRYFDDSRGQNLIYIINSEKPDLILIGNSVLQRNINGDLLDQKLSSLFKKPVHVTLLGAGSSHMDLWYVWLFHYITKANIANIPIGFVSYTVNSFTSTGASGAAPRNIKKYLLEDDDVFFAKYHRLPMLRSLLKIKPYCYLCYFSPDDSSELIKALLNTVYKPFSQPQEDAKTFLSNWLLSFDSSNDTPKKNLMFPTKFVNNFNDSTYIPDIFGLLKGHKVFFVITHDYSESPSRNMEQAKETMRNYISQYNATMLDMNSYSQLNNSSDYADNIHMTPIGRDKTTELLAQFIYEQHMLDK